MPEASARPLKLVASHVDTCIPCYWCGHHLAHLQTTVWKNMTLEELKEGLKREVSDGAWAGQEERTQDTHSQYEAWNEGARLAIDAITTKEEGALLFPDLEDSDGEDEGDSVYAFFAFMEDESGE